MKLKTDFGNIPITGIEEVEPGYLLGTIEVLGVQHHVEFIEVAYVNGVQIGVNGGYEDEEDAEGNNYDRIERLAQYDDSRWQTVEIDGRQYVCLITPFGQ